MKKLDFILATALFCFSYTTIHAQAIKLADRLQIKTEVDIEFHGTGNAVSVVTRNSTAHLESSKDLLWAGYYQSQPNNPRVFSLLSVDSPNGWGSFFTARANGRIGIMNDQPSVALEVGSPSKLSQIKVNGSVVWGSDARMKQNVKNLSGSLQSLKGLRSVTYQLKEQPVSKAIPDKILEDELLDPGFIQSVAAKAANQGNPIFDSREIYGFVAQELQELFPELVFEDEETGLLSVDYIGLIPVLVNGLQEQQTQIETLQKQQEVILQLLSEESHKFLARETGTTAVLHQNTPNPFTQSTEIGFYIPKSVTAANLYIYDYTGVQQKSLAIADREEGSVILDAGSLPSGIYFYTLICDGKPVDTKQMILTR